MNKRLYGVFRGNGKFVGLTTRIDEAMKGADRPDVQGTVRALSWGYYRDCGYSMDVPTFRTVSELVYDQDGKRGVHG